MGTESKFGDGGSASVRSCRRKVEKKECGLEPGDGRSKEEDAVVAEDVEAEVSVHNVVLG